MKKYTKLIAIILFLAIILGCMPIVVVATETETSQEQTLQETEVETTVTDELVLYDSQEIVTDEIIGEVVELESLREENVKHFRLSNGTYEAVSYGQAVHRKDADGVWQDINNDLTLKTVGTKQLYTTSDERVSFNKEANAFTLSENGYSIYMSLLIQQSSGNMTATTEPMTIEVDNQSVARAEHYDTLEAAIEINNKSSIVYSNVMANTDIEYIMSGNDLKENIIVKAKGDSYVYGFQLALSGLVPVLENNVISLRDEITNEEKYIIPAPYMYDANGEYSYDVEYGLIHAGGEKYLLTVTANEEWINDENRAMPVTIDPAIETSSNTEDTFINSIAAWGNHGNNSIMSVNSDSTSLIRIAIPTLPSGSMLLGADLIVKYYFSGSLPSDKVTQARQILGSWSESTVNYNNKPNISTTSLSSFSMVREGQSFNAPSTAEYDITNAVNNWYAGETNYGIAIMHTSGYEVAAHLKTSECNDDDYPYISLSYIHLITNGVYAFKNSAFSTMWMSVSDKDTSNNTRERVWAGNKLQADYLEDDSVASPVEAFTNKNYTIGTAGLFKISSVGTTGKYIIRSMVNNQLGLGVSADGNIITKNLPYADASVSSSDMFYIEWSGTGFSIRNVVSNYIITMKEYSTRDLIAETGINQYYYQTWSLVQYTGDNISNISLYRPPDWGKGIAIDKPGIAKLITWSTYNNANTPDMAVPTTYDDIVDWSVTGNVITITPKKLGTFKISTYIKFANGQTLGFISFSFVVIPKEKMYYIKNATSGQYLDIEDERIIQKSLANEENQLWVAMPVENSGGYVRIASFIWSDVIASTGYLGVDTNDITNVIHYSEQSQLDDYTLWKLETTKYDSLKFICKATEDSDLVLSVPLDASEDEAAEQTSYTENTKRNDEWILTEIKSRVRLYPRFDTTYLNRYGGASPERINTQMLELKDFYLNNFGILIYITQLQRYTSYSDQCSTNPNAVCTHADDNGCTLLNSSAQVFKYMEYHHTNAYNILSKLPSADTTQYLVLMYIGHRTCYAYLDEKGKHHHDPGPNGLAQKSKGVAIVMNHASPADEILTTIHEFGHFYGIEDHYGGLFSTTEAMNDQSGSNLFSADCMYGENRSSATASRTICDGCKATIEANLTSYNHS